MLAAPCYAGHLKEVRRGPARTVGGVPRGRNVPREIDRKLQLTVTALGLGTRKALAAAFRDANPDTVFDVARAHKWLQGRAQPREPQLYGDWLKVLGLDRAPAWLAECPVEELAEAL